MSSGRKWPAGPTLDMCDMLLIWHTTVYFIFTELNVSLNIFFAFVFMKNCLNETIIDGSSFLITPRTRKCNIIWALKQLKTDVNSFCFQVGHAYQQNAYCVKALVFFTL